MKFYVNPSILSGKATIPGNKSGTARGIVFGALAKGTSILHNPLTNLDSFSIVKMMRAIGATIDTSDSSVWKITGVDGRPKQPACVLDAENSGTGTYFTLAVASLIDGYSVLTGDYQICYRSAEPMLKAINTMGGIAFSTRGNGCCPIVVKGPIKGGEFSMPGVNSQWMTPFLCAGALTEKGVVIHESNLLEHPYVDMTIGMLKIAGIEVENLNYDEFRVKGGQKFHSFEYTLPGDWGSAGYPMVATAITPGSKAVFLGLNINDFAGEKSYVQILRNMGAKVSFEGDGTQGIAVEGCAHLRGIEIDCSGTPDAVPALAVLGTQASGKTVLHNIGACHLKETDRAQSIKQELEKMGGRLEEPDKDTLVIYKSDLHAAHIDGHNDHRIVMAMTVAGLATGGGESVIDNAEYAAVSFPNFYELMSSLNADIVRK